ncbi:oxidoreductase [Achromobacter xylosoxidans]|uniref:oxidoreductase n=1 Tax=Alcaligenes xylosoxydans xylosoxydans TaxID=85698 RepID=UPI001F12DAE3|nr:oxidoreductase [Achromobacter xylosoxidans]
MNTEITPVVAVVGPGAIGTTVAAMLHEVGRTPLLCGRTSRDHLTLLEGGRAMTVPGPVQTNPGQIRRTVGLVFLAVKATQIEAAAEWLAVLVGPETVVCVLQKGIEQVESVGLYAPRGRIVPAVVWFPAQAQSEGSVRLRGDVRLTLPDTSASRAVAEALQGTRCSVDLAENFSALAWRKLMQNAVAGLMVLTSRRSGMFARADIAWLVLAYLRECVVVARAEGIKLGDEVPQEILDKFQSAPADMGTSILTDLESGRPLEWDTRNGVVARRGRVHGVPTPISDILVPLLAAASDGPG